MKNYYEILEIQENASPEIIKAAYRVLAKKYHPDNAGIIGNKEKMLEISEAYEILSDQNKRCEYDIFLKNQRYEQSGHGERKFDESEQNENTEEQDNPSFFTSLIKEIGKSILDSMQESQKEFENAYLEGMAMDETMLIIRYKKAAGTKRGGYARALKERGFLEKNEEGKLVPTNKMRWYL